MYRSQTARHPLRASSDSHRRRGAHALAAMFLALLLPGVALAVPTLTGTPEELSEFLQPRPHTVNISGLGELRAFKDLARLSLRVRSEARELSAAMAANESLRGQMIDAFLAGGIPAEAINNARFASAPQYGLFGRKPSSYEVTARLQVEVNSEAQLQLVAAAADAHQGVSLEATEFEHGDEEEFERRVRELALAKVMEQKEYYEDSLDLELRAVNFHHGGVQKLARGLPATPALFDAADELAVRSEAAAVPPSFDEVEYRTSVTVVFQIISDD